MKKLLLIVIANILVMLSADKTFAQKQGQALIDSLTQELPKAKEDTSKVHLLIALSKAQTRMKDFDKAMNSANEVLVLAQKIKYKNGEALANIRQGSIFYTQGNYPESLNKYFLALGIFNNINNNAGIALSNRAIADDNYAMEKYIDAIKYYTVALNINKEINIKKELQLCFAGIGRCNEKLANYPDALTYYMEDLKLAEELGDKKIQGAELDNIGNIYFFIQDYDESVKFHTDALKVRNEIGDKYGLANTYNNIGAAYAMQRKFTDALINYEAALKLYTELKVKDEMATAYGNIGEINSNEENYIEANKNFTSCLELFNEIKNKDGIAWATLQIAKLNLKTKKYAESETQIKEALLLSKEIGSKYNIRTAYKFYTMLDSTTANWKGAYENYMMFIAYRDSMSNEENTKKLTQTSMQYLFDKQQDSIKLITEKQELALQKEIELKTLKFEYDKKQAAAKTEKEKQQLRYEQKIKEQEIEYQFAQKTAKVEALQKEKETERKQKEAITKIEQEKKDALTQEELRRQKNIRNSILLGFVGLLIFSVVVFRQRNKVKKEKKRSDELLLNILPSEVAEELKDTGAAAAKQYNDVTVLFTDFVGFTSISEKLSPTELVAEIHKNFMAFDGIIEKHGLEKIKTIGDAYMAVCGLPNETKDHAQQVVKAAQEIKEYIASSHGKFQIRIGIHSGPVVAGIVGVKKFAYDIWGDTVNTANRMEQNSEAGKINISGSTYELVKDEFNCEHRGKISVKGKGEIDMYFVD